MESVEKVVEVLNISKKRSNRKMIAMRLDKDMLLKAQSLAKTKGTTLTGLVEKLLEQEFKGE